MEPNLNKTLTVILTGEKLLLGGVWNRQPKENSQIGNDARSTIRGCHIKLSPTTLKEKVRSWPRNENSCQAFDFRWFQTIDKIRPSNQFEFIDHKPVAKKFHNGNIGCLQCPHIQQEHAIHECLTSSDKFWLILLQSKSKQLQQRQRRRSFPATPIGNSVSVAASHSSVQLM